MAMHLCRLVEPREASHAFVLRIQKDPVQRASGEQVHKSDTSLTRDTFGRWCGAQGGALYGAKPTGNLCGCTAVGLTSGVMWAPPKTHHKELLLELNLRSVHC